MDAPKKKRKLQSALHRSEGKLVRALVRYHASETRLVERMIRRLSKLDPILAARATELICESRARQSGPVVP